jgi:hypothetical protein
MSEVTVFLMVNKSIIDRIKPVDSKDLNEDEKVIKTMLEREIYPFNVKVNYVDMPIELGADVLCYTKDENGLYYGTKNKTI